MATLTPQDDFLKTALRLPKDLHGRLVDSAAANGRSLNSEINERLEASFKQRDAKLQELSEKVAVLEGYLTQPFGEEKANAFHNLILEKLAPVIEKVLATGPEAEAWNQAYAQRLRGDLDKSLDEDQKKTAMTPAKRKPRKPS